MKVNFLPGRAFADLEDFHRQLAQWLRYVNEERRCDATGGLKRAALGPRTLPRSRLRRHRTQPHPQRKSSTGKTHLCIAIAHKAIQHGHDARFG